MDLICVDEGDECKYWCSECGTRYTCYTDYEEDTIDCEDNWFIPRLCSREEIISIR
jgi:hypothetical protein